MFGQIDDKRLRIIRFISKTLQGSHIIEWGVI